MPQVALKIDFLSFFSSSIDYLEMVGGCLLRFTSCALTALNSAFVSVNLDEHTQRQKLDKGMRVKCIAHHSCNTIFSLFCSETTFFSFLSFLGIIRIIEKTHIPDIQSQSIGK